jgi:anti-sigma factor RsiW
VSAVTGSEGCGEIRRALGVYLLGAISPADRSAVDSHLARCADCRDELARLAGLPGLLRAVPAADVTRMARESPAGRAELPPPPMLRSLLDRTARLRRRRLWRCLAVTAAAAVTAAGGSVAVSRVLHPPAKPPGASAPQWVTAARGSNPRAGVGGTVKYDPQPWGPELDVQVSGIPAGTACELHVISSRGQDVVAGAWIVARGHPDAWYPASSPFPASRIRSFAVTGGGKTLVSIPAR